MFKNKEYKRKSLHSSVFSVILWINLCSMIVMSVFNYYVFHHKSGKAYLDSFLSYNKQVTDLAFGNIDRQIIQSVLKLPPLYFSPIKENESILLPQKESIEGSSVHIMALATEMRKIQKIYPYITGIDIYYESTNTIVTGFDKVHFPANEEQRDKYLPWYGSYKQAGPLKGSLWIKGSAYLMEEPVILYINRITRPDWKQKEIVMAIYISPESFGEYIDQKTGQFVITTKGGELLYDSKGGDGNLQGPKEKRMEFHNASLVSGLNYYYYVDSSWFYKDYDVTSRMFFFNFLLSILFNLIVLLVISYYNYVTYRKRLQNLSKEAGIVIGDSEKSFDKSLHVLAKEINTLHEAVDSSKGLMFQNSVRSLILNQNSGEHQEMIVPYLTRKNCCTVLIKLPETDLETLSVEELQAAYPPGVNRYDALFAMVEKQELAVVLIYDDGKWEDVKEAFIRDMDERWENYRLVSGQSFGVLKAGIKNSYISALETARYQYIFTKEKYLACEQIGIESRKESGSHIKLFEAIRKDINNESLLDLKARVEMLVVSFKNGNYTIEYCISTLRDFVTLLYQAMEQNQLDMWVVFGYDIRDYYKKIPDIDVFHCWCNDICETVLKNIHQKKQSVDVDMRTEILSLVDEYLEHDISLDLLADRLQIRQDAASRMFRQIMGMGYTDYIKNRKLSRAKELMSQGYSVKDTAERLGYSSAQYFIKVFKENCGITPYQYKKTQEKETEDS